MNASDRPSAYNRAIAILVRREYSVYELNKKLHADQYAQEEIDDALAQLQAAGMQSDERFCEIFVRSRIQRGQGPLKINAELQERGIHASLIALALEAAEVDWNALAEEVLVKRFTSAASQPKEKVRQLRFLASRGFPSDVSYSAISNAWREG